MYVKEYDIWEPINQDSDVYQSIRNTTNVIIDGNITPQIIAISDLNLISHCINGDLALVLDHMGVQQEYVLVWGR